MIRSVQQSVSFAPGTYSADACGVLARAWCHKVQHFLIEELSHHSAEYHISAAALDAYPEPSELVELAAAATGLLKRGVLQIRAIFGPPRENAPPKPVENSCGILISIAKQLRFFSQAFFNRLTGRLQDVAYEQLLSSMVLEMISAQVSHAVSRSFSQPLSQVFSQAFSQAFSQVFFTSVFHKCFSQAFSHVFHNRFSQTFSTSFSRGAAMALPE